MSAGMGTGSCRRLHQRQRRSSESGAASVELVLITPVLVAILLLLVAGGRLAIAGQSVESAAAAAARAVSLEPSSSGASAVAITTAERTILEHGVPCSSVTVTVDAAALDAMLGLSGSVHVTVHCTVPLGDVTLPSIEGVRTMTATASSPVDAYRARG